MKCVTCITEWRYIAASLFRFRFRLKISRFVILNRPCFHRLITQEIVLFGQNFSFLVIFFCLFSPGATLHVDAVCSVMLSDRKSQPTNLHFDIISIKGCETDGPGRPRLQHFFTVFGHFSHSNMSQFHVSWLFSQ